MENSQAYKDFIKQIKATGREKMDGYYPLTLENICEWEREEVEDIIWDNFVHRNDSDLSIFMPKLKKYNGIDALKSKLDMYDIPSGGSVNVSEALYIATDEKKYLDLITENYKLSNDKTPLIVRLSYLAKKNDVYSFLMDVYIHDYESKNQLCALRGILWSDGYLKSLDDLKEFSQNMDFLKIFKADSADKRKELIMKYKKGELKKEQSEV